MHTIVIATGNAAKAREMRALLAVQPCLVGLRFVTPQELGQDTPFVDESGATFARNALLKAQAYALRLGLPALADDSGLCVDALGGAPGVRSARWAGPTDGDRNEALLALLQDVPDVERGARFVCTVCLVTPDGRTITAEGECSGRILRAPRGENGFGYDPLFWLPELGLTMAQLSTAQKNAVSHRARAIAAIAPIIAGL